MICRRARTWLSYLTSARWVLTEAERQFRSGPQTSKSTSMMSRNKSRSGGSRIFRAEWPLSAGTVVSCPPTYYPLAVLTPSYGIMMCEWETRWSASIASTGVRLSTSNGPLIPHMRWWGLRTPLRSIWLRHLWPKILHAGDSQIWIINQT